MKKLASILVSVVKVIKAEEMPLASDTPSIVNELAEATHARAVSEVDGPNEMPLAYPTI